jgi:eukaryotic-like serine/threonine-protein kinase
MLEREREEKILERAIQKGFIARVELQQLESTSEEENTLLGKLCWGMRIDRLLKMGRLTEAIVKTLEFEIENGVVATLNQGEAKKTNNRKGHTSRENADTLPLPPFPSSFDKDNISGEPTLTPDLRIEFPISDWDRYHFERVLGEGGMGTVFLARDPRLNRFVALKFIRGDNPRLIKRFVQEAKAQARIDHEHVCKVYEVGEVEGKQYIAMQYIPGESVQSAGAKMSLEQKAKVIKDAAEALHAAHRMGIIHRDIKPANIMVERAEDGSWIPILMDFGLARDLGGEQGLTETGVIMGTPSYMAPEQARGDLHKLDRRADVYSLGATFYELLSEKPPFEGSNFETLTKVVNQEPEPLRKLVPSIPRDLETITMKCLEKDPNRRYDSAKALADELQRYLEGEPILAQQSSLFYRIAKQVKKHRATYTIASIALVIVLVLMGVAIRERFNADQKARLAQQFGQEAERIEGILQRAYLLPMHDIRPEQALVKERMDNIRSSMSRAGRIGAEAGNFALGRGYIALHDYEQARFYLELARKSGYTGPEISYALGQVMGELYRKHMEEAERIPQKELRDALKKQIEKDYKEPALSYLNEYVAAGIGAQKEEAAYIEGQIAFYKKDYDTALTKAREAFLQAPWLYEAKKLEGNVYIALGREKADRGNYDEAIQDFDRAGEAFKQASEIGRSDDSVYDGDADRWIQVMELERRRGGPFKDAFEKVLSSTDKALQVFPDCVDSYIRKSKSYWRWGEYQDRHGEDPLPSLEKAAEMAKIAIELISKDNNAGESIRDAYENLSNAYRRKGEYEMRHALDPRTSFDRAIENVNRAIQLYPNYAPSYNTLGLILDSKGLYERNHGQDPFPSWDKAIEAHQKTTHLTPDLAGYFNNLGVVYVYKAQYEIRRGKDAGAILDLALQAYQKAIELNPNLANAFIGLGQIYHNKALYLKFKGEDPRIPLDEAIGNYQKSIQLNPNNAYVYNNLSYSLELKGRYEAEIGNDPTPAFNQARSILEKSNKIDPSDSFCYSHQGTIEVAAGLWAIRQKQSPMPYFEKARKKFQQALDLDSENNFFYQAMAELDRRQAEWKLKRGERPEKELEHGLSMIEKSLQINSSNSEAVALQGALYLLKAPFDPGAAEKAKDILEKVLETNSQLQHEFGPLLTEARKLAVR